VTDTPGKLTDEQKEYVVERLAAFDSPAEIAKDLLQDFDVAITRQSIEFYDPTKVNGRNCPERWKALFFARRQEIIDGNARLGAVHQMVRIRWLERMATAAMAQGNHAIAVRILERIHKEVGAGVAKRAAQALSDRERALAFIAYLDTVKASQAEDGALDAPPGETQQ
jgi:hypothetical protein